MKYLQLIQHVGNDTILTNPAPDNSHYILPTYCSRSNVLVVKFF